MISLTVNGLFGQTYHLLTEEKNNESFRGLSFEDAKTFIFSGTNNTIGKSSDSGKTIQWISPDLTSKVDFRDVEVVAKNHYFAMGIDSPAYILETKDAGKIWQTVYENQTKGIFLDAMFYYPKTKDLFVVGDPLGENIPFVLQANLKNTKEWIQQKKIKNQYLRLSDPKEAFFAASGSNLYVDDQQVLLISGGVKSLLYRYTAKETQGYSLDKSKSSTSGMYAMDYNSTLNVGYLVGGDYTKPDASNFNLYKFKIQENKVQFIDTYASPKGYLSSVSIIDKDRVVVCGTNGVQMTNDNGLTWKFITNDGYNSCKVSPDKKYIILVGGKGKLGKIEL